MKPSGPQKEINYQKFLNPMTDLAASRDFDGDGKLTWRDSLATNTVVVEHHLNNVRKILKIKEVQVKLDLLRCFVQRWG